MGTDDLPKQGAMTKTAMAVSCQDISISRQKDEILKFLAFNFCSTGSNKSRMYSEHMHIAPVCFIMFRLYY